MHSEKRRRINYERQSREGPDPPLGTRRSFIRMRFAAAAWNRNVMTDSFWCYYVVSGAAFKGPSANESVRSRNIGRVINGGGGDVEDGPDVALCWSSATLSITRLSERV
jgi:hypothetical protein